MKSDSDVTKCESLKEGGCNFLIFRESVGLSASQRKILKSGFFVVVLGKPDSLPGHLSGTSVFKKGGATWNFS